ncbi:NAD-dependent dehydratase [candidate division WOR-1 bacterium RIFOXYD2_FULL_36_8]|uniref:NAD-dependent dehydratase n=1 Tax=candidate division WOR-1 bacterium RIFOXYB2_FULL_36_35 TaxID=1802578 RepID=A0A1F4S5A7_UNCSA|nr:MAG: NAD-dependent dehydratase [candidate division WOR-1 bacterium RIFOXYA2_FULL_36_21]OGC15618.1 MAG: NAD-dependent dehydratase [candidate division WOR-1 bacterium RIFOXYB2_FULL_36_35]OGC37163.1 MAG: NAD-dependent dehydratase [candidate division WOR-1 bacterium RIFOXYD2_FULL_36_8]
MKKILITGGYGFIAKNLLEQLGEEYNIFSYNRQQLDLLDSSKVLAVIKKSKFDVIIHTATYDAAPKHSKKDPSKVLENNLRMFFNIVRCKDYFGKMIYFGSGAEYSREHWKPKMKEAYFDKHVPSDQYGYSKYLMSKYVELNNNLYNLRLFAVFGKYEDWRVRVISSICRDAVLDLPIIINQNKYYDFMYIDDLIKIIKWFIENKPLHKIHNICSGNVIDFKTIAQKVCKISGKKLKIVIKERKLGKEYSGDNLLLLSEIKRSDFTLMDKALEKLYRFYDTNRSLLE